MRRKTLVGAALAALMLGGAGESVAADIHAKVTIKSKRVVGKDKIFGRVIAKDRACVVGRKVRLIITRPDRSKNRVASMKTDSKGRWKFIPESGNAPGGYTNEGDRYADPGDYLAKIGQVNLKGRDGHVSCRASKSKTHYVG